MTAIINLPDGAKPRKVKVRTPAPAVDDLERAIDALHSIPPDIGREDWVRVGMAAHAAGIGFDDFDQWSAGAESYDQRSARDTWRSFKNGGGIGAGTLFKMAEGYGFNLKASSASSKTPRATLPRPPAPAAIRRTEKPVKKYDPAEVWNRCAPVVGHDYIVGKNAEGVPLDDLRVVPAGDSLPIMGTSMAGALVVPCRGANGQLASLQFVTAGDTAARLKAAGKKTKLNLPGHSMNGWHVVGDVVPGDVVYVCEGIGQAWACWQATGRAAVVAFGWSSVKKVAAALLELHPDATLVLVPDAGKEADAANIALALGVQCVELPEGLPNNFDVSDLAARDGLEALELLLANPVKPEVAPAMESDVDEHKLPLGVVLAHELSDVFEPPDELVEGVITAGAASVIYGDSNSGKTFLAIDMACAVARGVDWHGRKVEQGLVVYLAAESPVSVRSRLQAYQQHHGCKVPDFAVVQTPVNLFDGDMAELILSIKAIERHVGKKVKLIIGDTLARLSAGANENSGQDMGVVVSNFDYIRAETGAHFMLIHHSGKDAAKGMRGHSCLRAAIDTEIEVTEAAQVRCAEMVKQRDLFSKGVRIGFKLDVIELGVTKWGKPATSCVVAPVDAPEKQVKERKMGVAEGAVLEFLRGQTGVAVRIADVVKHFNGQYARGSIYRAIEKLDELGAVNYAKESRLVSLSDLERGS